VTVKRKRSSPKKRTSKALVKSIESVDDDVMDGAAYPFGAPEGSTPLDFMDDENGERSYGFHTGGGVSGSGKRKPWGTAVANLKDGIADKIIPPRSIWVKGDWKGDRGEAYYTWVVSGEGTPGSYLEREYRIPDQISKEMVPAHPADWPQHLQKKKGGFGFSGASSSGASSSLLGGKSSGHLPLGLRIRCPGCGHFFKDSDLATHAKSQACAAVQDDPAMWVIECECHPGDLQIAATCLEGFPLPKPEPKPAPAGEDPVEKIAKAVTAAPDPSGAESESEPEPQPEEPEEPEPSTENQEEVASEVG